MDGERPRSAVSQVVGNAGGDCTLNGRRWPSYRRWTVAPFHRAGFRLVFVAAVFACGGRFNPSAYPTPEALFEAALAEFEQGDCGAAEIGLERLTFELPARDPRQAEVRYYLAECQFKRKRYLESTREYRRVSDQHAQDSLAPLALLRAGDAYAKLWRRPELDATYGASALATYEELLTRYPTSAAAAQARERIAQLNDGFARKDYKTGIFYLRLKAYDSAIIYFKSVVANFPQSSSAPQALLRLVEAYERIGYQEDKRDMCLQLRRFYPDALARATTCLADTTSQ